MMRKRFRWGAFFLFFAVLSTFVIAATGMIHTVQKGESLFSICKKYGTSPSVVMRLNGIKEARKIQVGQKLKIPVQKEISRSEKIEQVPSQKSVLEAPERYVVQRGEGYREICQKFNLKELDIRSLNHDVDLEAGVVLILKSKLLFEKGDDSTRKKQGESEAEKRYLFINSVKHLIDLPTIQKGRWKYIVVHHSATSSGNAAIFDLAHRQRGMENGLAYHFVIGNGKDTKDGEIEVGNRWLKQLQGGHLRSDVLNQIALGICLVGNFEEVRPTRRQQAATIELISYLRDKLGKPYPVFKGHREINPMPTTCPGRNFPLSAFHQIFDEE